MSETADEIESEEWGIFASGQTLRLTGTSDDAATLARIEGRCRRKGLAFTLTFSPARKEGHRAPERDRVHIRLGINV